MKKIILFALLLVVSLSYSQKKSNSKTKIAATTNVLGKLDNLTIEMSSDKTNPKMLLLIKKDTGIETLELNNSSSNFKPLNVELKAFTTNGTKLYFITWKENSKTETKLKKENIETVTSQIWNITDKELLIGNVKKKTHIIETVYLDKLKSATETQERNKSEGYDFILLTNGDFILKTKTQDANYVYNVASKKYEIKKLASKKK